MEFSDGVSLMVLVLLFFYTTVLRYPSYFSNLLRELECVGDGAGIWMTRAVCYLDGRLMYFYGTRFLTLFDLFSLLGVMASHRVYGPRTGEEQRFRALFFGNLRGAVSMLSVVVIEPGICGLRS